MKLLQFNREISPPRIKEVEVEIGGSPVTHAGRFRIYELIAFNSASYSGTLAKLNAIMKELGRHYKIPARTITEDISV